MNFDSFAGIDSQTSLVSLIKLVSLASLVSHVVARGLGVYSVIALFFLPFEFKISDEKRRLGLSKREVE